MNVMWRKYTPGFWWLVGKIEGRAGFLLVVMLSLVVLYLLLTEPARGDEPGDARARVAVALAEGSRPVTPVVEPMVKPIAPKRQFCECSGKCTCGCQETGVCDCTHVIAPREVYQHPPTIITSPYQATQSRPVPIPLPRPALVPATTWMPVPAPLPVPTYRPQPMPQPVSYAPQPQWQPRYQPQPAFQGRMGGGGRRGGSC